MATSPEIKKKYHDLARRYHPDRATDKETATRLFAQINLAYRTLMSDIERAKYDAQLDAQAAEANRPARMAASAAANARSAQSPAPSPKAASRPYPTTPLGANGTKRPVQKPAAAASNPQQDIGRMIDEARALLFRGSRDQALVICRKILAVSSANFDALCMSGDIYLDQGRRVDALVAYQMALRSQPGNKMLQDKVRRLQALPASPAATRPMPTAKPGATAKTVSVRPQEKLSLFKRLIGGK